MGVTKIFRRGTRSCEKNFGLRVHLLGNFNLITLHFIYVFWRIFFFHFTTQLIHEFRGGMGGGGLKVSPPPSEIFVKWHFWWNFLLFCLKNAIFQKIFGTSRDYHKSAIKFSKFFWPLPPLKIFLNPYPPPKIFGPAHVWPNSYISTAKCTLKWWFL